MNSSSTYNLLWVSFKCCLILIFVDEFFLNTLKRTIHLVGVLIMSGHWDWSLRSLINSGKKYNEIIDQQSQWDNVTLTKNSDDLYHTSIFHCFNFWIEWIGRDIVSVGHIRTRHRHSWLVNANVGAVTSTPACRFLSADMISSFNWLTHCTLKSIVGSFLLKRDSRLSINIFSLLSNCSDILNLGSYLWKEGKYKYSCQSVRFIMYNIFA